MLNSLFEKCIIIKRGPYLTNVPYFVQICWMNWLVTKISPDNSFFQWKFRPTTTRITKILGKSDKFSDWWRKFHATNKSRSTKISPCKVYFDKVCPGWAHFREVEYSRRRLPEVLHYKKNVISWNHSFSEIYHRSVDIRIFCRIRFNSFTNYQFCVG